MPGRGVGNGLGLTRNRQLTVAVGDTVYGLVTDDGTPIVTDAGDQFVTDPLSLVGLFVLGEWLVTAAGDLVRII